MTLPEPLLADPRQGVELLGDIPAVFAIHAAEGKPYIARTTMLRRRLNRLLKPRTGGSRFLNLHEVAERVEYWPVGSSLEGMVLFYALARHHFPEDYLKMTKLKMPSFVRVVLSNQFPRTQISTRLTASAAFQFGPFRTRVNAENFEGQFLDLFQLRRCQEDLVPTTEHPGCIYGEMNMCLRPCQEVVGEAEYRTEAQRVVEFLRSEGQTLIQVVTTMRDRMSAEMEFEEAARQHKRLEKVQAVLKLRDDLARDIELLNGIALTRSIEQNAVELWFVLGGVWQTPHRFSLAVVEGKPEPLDKRLREVAATIARRKTTVAERQENIALLAKWFYSSWREGEWVGFDSLELIPYRRLVNAVHRVATAEKSA